MGLKSNHLQLRCLTGRCLMLQDDVLCFKTLELGVVEVQRTQLWKLRKLWSVYRSGGSSCSCQYCCFVGFFILRLYLVFVLLFWTSFPCVGHFSSPWICICFTCIHSPCKSLTCFPCSWAIIQLKTLQLEK